MASCKIHLTSGPISIQRGIDTRTGEKFIRVLASAEATVHPTKRLALPIPLEQMKDQNWPLEDLPVEIQDSIKALIDFCEGKIREKAKPKAQEIVADLGMTVE